MQPRGDKRLPNAQARTAALQATLADLTARRSNVVKKFAAVPSVAEKLPSRTAATNPIASSEPATNAETDAAVQAAKAIIQQQIRRLNDYNEMRDVGQELMGIIAESRGVRIKEVQEEFGISAND
ncbi:putative dna repair protein swi5 [Diplodia seriata]|uniref:Putative dna repair protein swi5 n=1 Tax=Diplodia seriata TaxID=420778 RepID=A0A0G2GV80_9PEZI|nr:putative dna repair protein swi5 [Diplodia seriata]